MVELFNKIENIEGRVYSEEKKDWFWYIKFIRRWNLYDIGEICK